MSIYAVTLANDADEKAFRDKARKCLLAGLEPEQIVFVASDADELIPPAEFRAKPGAEVSVPKSYYRLLQRAIPHADRVRFALLYEVLWRIHHGERALVSRASDPAIRRLDEMAKNVGRDIHKMHAFLRFRPVIQNDEEIFTAWFEPRHYILKQAAPFFRDRFAQMRWLIATPQGTASWDLSKLHFGPPIKKPPVENDYALDELWLTYFRTTFNPARLRVNAMTAEMPKHYWANMPEAAEIPKMIAEAPQRAEILRAETPARPPRFADRIAERSLGDKSAFRAPLPQLQDNAKACTRCPLHQPATQTVFGEGPQNASLMIVGEQPGDQEDLSGRPFVGPAGRLLDSALAQAGIDRDRVYLTNAVKHFKFTPRGKRRIHNKPDAAEINACRFWLEAELDLIKPQLVVAMGSSAARALSGRAVAVMQNRGLIDFSGKRGFLTVHPSFLLRLTDPETKRREYLRFVDDLTQIRNLVPQAAVDREREETQ